MTAPDDDDDTRAGRTAPRSGPGGGEPAPPGPGRRPPRSPGAAASIEVTGHDAAASDTSGLGGEVDRLVAGTQHDPHAFLGRHHLPEGGVVVRVWHPRAVAAELRAGGAALAMERVDERGLFEVQLGAVPQSYTVHLRDEAGGEWEQQDAYRFPPTVGDLDLHLIGQGQHHQLWNRLGARLLDHGGVAGAAFAVWAPNARSVSVVGDMTGWDDRIYPMRSLGASGVWELFIPGVVEGARYKYAVVRADGSRIDKADPLAKAAEVPPATASIVVASHHVWADGDWMQRRAQTDWTQRPVAIYEVHLGSWRRDAANRSLTYAEAAEQLGGYVRDLGFTHVQLLPVAEHPFSGSWGYQVTGYYAPTSRYGTPDELRAMVDALHNQGIGVIVDWVPAHFPRDEWALARFDGTALYEHVDPRRGEQPDWGTYVFNFGRSEVRNFLTANARYWCEEFHVDGLRVDAVASMLYLDYSRKAGEWVPNRHGGRENLEAIDLLREVTESLRIDHRGTLTIAEESTAWPGVTSPAAAGGLGFTMKWNMGWMHDTLDYWRNDPVFRRYHHHQLTFGLWYAWSERFVLPLSHDEVVHGKGSLYGKMPGDRWQRLANLRSLLAWMWAHPGKKLLFMGGEIAQEHEWSEERALDWHLLDDPGNRGVQRLMRDVNHRYRAEPSLWERDASPDGFRWVDAGNADQNVLSFLRIDASGHAAVACVANLSPNVHHGFRVGLPTPGAWRELLNTDAAEYGGSGVGNLGSVAALEVPWHGQPCSASVTLPPLGVLWLGSPEAAS